MGIKSLISRPLAAILKQKHKKWAANPWRFQCKIFENLITEGRRTSFGEDHDFNGIRDHADYMKRTPVRDYEGISTYIERLKNGEENVLWPGKPLYFAKTSGTTSGVKYIPISKSSIGNHINTAKDALLSYVADSGNASFLNGKMIFLSGSPEMETTAGIATGRLSGIVNHHVPNYLRGNQLPSYKTNCIEDWETKLTEIVKETRDQKMTLISGIPPWVQMYFDYLVEEQKKPISEIFPDFSLFVHGGVNFEPYRNKLWETVGKEIDSIETFPASEGFFAYQDLKISEGLILNIDAGIFYEFIPMEEFHSNNPRRLNLREVELDVQYSLVLTSNAGLWSYSIGDTIKFVSKNPYRLVVTGRVKHFISAFGEHVIGEEVENSMRKTLIDFPSVHVLEFTVAPQINPEKGKSSHEWLVEFAQAPESLSDFAKTLDENLQEANSYYKDLIQGVILRPLKITPLQKNAFREYMKSIGKLGGQNKVPRLSNDRKIADNLIKRKI
jgi:GH3 auxin-responsive promoter